MSSNKELAHRARLTWLRRFPNRAEPTWSATTVEEHGGRVYVVLRRGAEVVDIYRYKPQGDQLRLLSPTKSKRYWPVPHGTYARAGGYAAV
jgi:hypothetical protein